MESFFAWEPVYPIGALILLLALIYGTLQYRRRSRREERRAERVVRDRYEHPEKWSE